MSILAAEHVDFQEETNGFIILGDVDTSTLFFEKILDSDLIPEQVYEGHWRGN